MTPQVTKLINSGVVGVIYNGDVDIVCNFMGDQWFADSLGFAVEADYSPWHVDGQVAGFVKHFEKGLAFVTVKGSGHMVPRDKPAAALALFHNVIKKRTSWA